MALPQFVIKNKKPFLTHFAKENVSSTEDKNKLDDFLDVSLDSSHEYGEVDFITNTNPIKPRGNNPVYLLTSKILQTYKNNKKYKFQEEMKPRRELTDPTDGVCNDGRDNVNNELIVYVGDIIKNNDHNYVVVDLLGNGISGQVFECLLEKNNSEENKNHESESSITAERYALKIIKNRRAYAVQALIEIKILDRLNKEIDPYDKYHFIKKIDSFYYKNHVCIVFELLNENLYELLKKNYFKGLSLKTVRYIIKTILEGVETLHKKNIIHCDLKPENILLKILPNDIQVKITDFGTACDKTATQFVYLQSRYYRSPEVIIGNPYSTEIDLWSIGCIAAELYLGDPLFPGSCEYDQIFKIVQLIGPISKPILNMRKFSQFFNMNGMIKSPSQYYSENPTQNKPSHSYPHNITSLDDIVNIKTKVDSQEIESFIWFLKSILVIDPKKRITAKEALKHPFITKKKMNEFLIDDESKSSIQYSVEAYNKLNSSNIMNNSFNNSISGPYQYQPKIRGKGINNLNSSFNYYGPNSFGHNYLPIPNYNHQVITNQYNNQNLNNSANQSCFELDPSKIPYKALMNFPYVKMNEVFINQLKPIKQVINKYLEYNNPMLNKSYSDTNFTKLEGEPWESIMKSKKSKKSNKNLNKSKLLNSSGYFNNSNNNLFPNYQNYSKNNFAYNPNHSFNYFNNDINLNIVKRTRSYTDHEESGENINKIKTNAKVNWSNNKLDQDLSNDNLNHNKAYKFGSKKLTSNQMIKEEDEH